MEVLMEKAVFVALDLPNKQAVTDLLAKLGSPKQTYLKIGMELFYHVGANLVTELSQQGYQIFLDLKLHDIPNTVYHAAKQLAQLGIYCTTVHALGGSEMIAAARSGLAAGSPAGKPLPKLLAVTELTSISPAILKNEQNCVLPMQEQVISLAKMAKKAGADGVICSPLETAAIRQQLGSEFLCVTPGIRLKSNPQDDQKRVTTPQKACKLGASAIVVGRPITQAADPQNVYQTIKQEFN